jgi:hypothetical protein
VQLTDNFDAFDNYLIEPLGKKHNRAACCCGVDQLDKYFQEQAGQDARKYIARSFYEHYQFICFPDYSHRLFLMMETIAKMINLD